MPRKLRDVCRKKSAVPLSVIYLRRSNYHNSKIKERTVTKFCSYASLVAFSIVLTACGGGITIPPGPIPVGFTPVNIQGQYQVIGRSTINPNGVLLVEANFTQTGNDTFASKSNVVLIQGTQTSTGITLDAVGGECDNKVIGGDSIQGTFSSTTQLSFTLTEAGGLGTGTATGSITFSSDGTQITAGTYTIPAACGFAADSGTVTGNVIHPFSGSYAGMLANSSGTTDAVIVTVSQSNFNLTVSGTDNGAQFSLTGSSTGATFDVSGTIAGQAVQYVGVYDPTANDFLVYDISLNFLGTLKAGTNPQSISKTIGLLAANK